MTMYTDDVIAIQTLKARYCVAVDGLSTSAEAARGVFRDIFTADVAGDYGMGPMAGADALIAFLCDMIAANSEWRIHMIHTPLIVVNGDTATGDWTLSIHLKRAGGTVDALIGRYADTFRRTADGWRIASLRFLNQS